MHDAGRSLKIKKVAYMKITLSRTKLSRPLGKFTTYVSIKPHSSSSKFDEFNLCPDIKGLLYARHQRVRALERRNG